MALTCTIYENNFKSEVMKSNNKKNPLYKKLHLLKKIRKVAIIQQLKKTLKY